jgi:hypothetical protein
MKRAKIIIWTILTILFAVSVIRAYSYDLFSIDLLIQWTFRIISFGAVICIFWCAVGVFTRKIKVKIVSVTIMVALCGCLYFVTHIPTKVVRMQEDVLYILPK